MATIAMLEAIDRAIQAEEKACAFYSDASSRTKDAGGASMFRELAEFEAHHREHLTALKNSLSADRGWIVYEGRNLTKTPGSEASGRPAVGDHADALEALRLAIAAEERAVAEYTALSDAAGNDVGREAFRRLADEERMHRKLLDEQYLALANRGVWFWND
ncbi:MAG: ferritin family protein [Deltaproteobacteria bacterium]|nr:ferritin family protein [Deltaproteobacteria bacterium]